MCQYVNAPIGYTVLLKDIAKLTHWQIVHYWSVLNIFHHRVTRRSTGFKSLLKRKWTQIFTKGNKCMIKNYSLLICVSSDKYYSVELCVTLWWVLLISDQKWIYKKKLLRKPKQLYLNHIVNDYFLAITRAISQTLFE